MYALWSALGKASTDLVAALNVFFDRHLDVLMDGDARAKTHSDMIRASQGRSLHAS